MDSDIILLIVFGGVIALLLNGWLIVSYSNNGYKKEDEIEND